MKQIGIVSSQQSDQLIAQIERLKIENVQIVDYLKDADKFEIGADIVVFNDLNPEVIEGNKDQFLDNLRDNLAKTEELLLVNLENEWVAELTKEIMKYSKVTVLDFSKNQFGNAGGVTKAVYTLGMNFGLSIEEVEGRLSA